MNGAILLPKDADMELWVQDDLSSLSSMTAIIEGVIII